MDERDAFTRVFGSVVKAPDFKAGQPRAAQRVGRVRIPVMAAARGRRARPPRAAGCYGRVRVPQQGEFRERRREEERGGERRREEERGGERRREG